MLVCEHYTNLGGNMSCKEDAKKLQCDLAELDEWAKAWQMPVNMIYVKASILV